MAKKIKKVIARLMALEKTVARLLSPASRRAKKARKAKKTKRAVVKKIKAVKKSKRKAISKKNKVAKKAATPSRGVPTKKLAAKAHHKKTKRKATRRIPPPTIEQLAPSGAPEFVQPLDQV